MYMARLGGASTAHRQITENERTNAKTKIQKGTQAGRGVTDQRARSDKKSTIAEQKLGLVTVAWWREGPTKAGVFPHRH
jgi:hypothetical protein